MKLQAEVNSEIHEVEISHDGDKLSARVDDRTYSLDQSEPESNIFLLKNEGNIFEAFVAPAQNSNSSMCVKVRNQEYEINIIDPKRLRGKAGSHEHADGQAEIKSAMPGKVVRILVEAGAEVKKGDGILVVEAMKMQNEMKSPKDGQVKEIRVAENNTVGAGDVLVVIE